MYPWAVQFKELIVTDPMVLLSMAAFVGVLGVAYLYVLKKGALNWKA
jgi:NADH:ubiquinone oxidoreductase subunit 3 (subunit A)